MTSHHDELDAIEADLHWWNRLYGWVVYGVILRPAFMWRLEVAWRRYQIGRAIYPADWRTGLDILREALSVPPRPTLEDLLDRIRSEDPSE